VLASLALAGGLFFQIHRGGGGAAAHDRNSVKGSTEPGTVLVARRLIPKGTSWYSIAYFNLFAVVTIPKGQIAPGAISDPAVLQGRVAAVDIYPNQQLETSNFSRRFDLTVRLVHVTSPVSAGSYATLTVSVSRTARCSITVYAYSGPSTDPGLYPERGRRISWTWKVGTRTTPGRWPITVRCGLAGMLHTSFRTT
jgi:hypothetical protein